MGDYFVCSKTDPVVETKAGKVRGFRLNTTYAFHGIHYAEADRFQMPQPVKPWKGIKNALAYGYVCPLLKQDAILFQHAGFMELQVSKQVSFPRCLNLFFGYAGHSTGTVFPLRVRALFFVL